MAISVKQFDALVAAHDITYAYSEDPRVLARGRREKKRIHDHWEDVGSETACLIWNYHVALKFNNNPSMMSVFGIRSKDNVE